MHTKFYILNKDLPITNEIVHRKENKDDRRQIHNKKSANDIIYLGTDNNFRKNTEKFLPNKDIESLFNKFTQKNTEEIRGKRAMQSETGILVKHEIDLGFLKLHIPFIDSYLKNSKHLYKNPNFDEKYVSQRIEYYLSESKTLIFYSDIVYISDKVPRPYFKWFRDTPNKGMNENFDFLKEFFIPKIGFWNFEIKSYMGNQLHVIWKVTYTDIIYSYTNYKNISKKAKDFLIERSLINLFKISNDEERNTVRNAISKIRLNQSVFRKNLLKSNRNHCLFTTIKTPTFLLTAGHIKPWSESTNLERLDINNGILLTPTFDKLFDKFLISFDKEGNVIYSTKVTEDVWTSLFPKFQDLKEQKIKIDITEHNKSYIDFHRNKFNEIQNEHKN